MLRTTHRDIQDHDERKGKAYPLKLRIKKTYKTVKKRYKSTNHQDQEDDADEDEDEDDKDESADVLVEDVERMVRRRNRRKTMIILNIMMYNTLTMININSMRLIQIICR